MLFQPQPRTSFARRAIAVLAALLASVGRNREDGAYLDGMRQGELEDLGLRRSDDGGYRFFK